MLSVLFSVLLTFRTSARSRAALQLEVLALRHQLQVLQRTRPRRLRLAMMDRWLWAVPACASRICRQAASASWTRSRQWETQRTLFSSALAIVWPPATNVNGVWPSNDAWL